MMVAWLTMKLKHILILLAAFLLSACSQTVDIYFYSDESWKVSSKVVLDKLELQAMDLADQYLQDAELPFSTQQLADGLSDGGLEALRAQYANAGIDFRWSGAGTVRSFSARGQTLSQFNNLLPGVVTITKEAEDQYRLSAEFTEGMIIASPLYHLDITLHAGKIHSSNAFRQRGGSAQWTNPASIRAVFSPASTFPWVILLVICLGVSALVPILMFAGKKKCPQCGKWISKKNEYCTHFGEVIDGSSSSGDYF